MKPVLQNSDNIIVNCCTSFSTLWMSCEANTSSTSAESVVQLSASWVEWEEMRKEVKEGKEGKGRERGRVKGEWGGRTRERMIARMGGGRRVCVTCRFTWSAFCDWSIFDLMESSSTSLFIDWAVSLSTCEKGYFIHTQQSLIIQVWEWVLSYPQVWEWVFSSSMEMSFLLKYGNEFSPILKYGNEFSPIRIKMHWKWWKAGQGPEDEDKSLSSLFWCPLWQSASVPSAG